MLNYDYDLLLEDCANFERNISLCIKHVGSENTSRALGLDKSQLIAYRVKGMVNTPEHVTMALGNLERFIALSLKNLGKRRSRSWWNSWIIPGIFLPVPEAFARGYESTMRIDLNL